MSFGSDGGFTKQLTKPLTSLHKSLPGMDKDGKKKTTSTGRSTRPTISTQSSVLGTTPSPQSLGGY